MGEIKDIEKKERGEYLDFRIKEILLALGYDPENFDPEALTVAQFQEMIDAGAFGPNGIVISGDHGGPIDAE
ncbi:MAG: hypothetical protein WC981_00970 [Candidatus Dojkabacteria bacterium]